jgi:integrase
MASISTNQKNSRRTLHFTGPDEVRRTISLGKLPKREAETFRLKVEAIIAAKLAGVSVAPEVSRWIADLPDEMARKLAKAGLAAPRQNVTLGEAMKMVFEGRRDVKPATKTIWRQSQRTLVEYFGENEPIRNITRANAEDFKQHLIGSGLGNGTIRERLQTASMVFNAMISREVIEKNPFSGVSVPATVDQSRNVFVSRDDVYRVMEQSPDAEWRLIIALSRFAGLRCPSETLSLKWENVRWDQGKIVVVSQKTERHLDGDQRTIPLFSDLEGPLRDAFEQAEPGAIYVIERHRSQAAGPNGWRNANLRTQFHKMIRRAGLKPWPKPFHAMRASFETELVEKTNIQNAANILGHSPSIAVKHYLRMRPEDFEKVRTADFGGDPKSYVKSYVTSTQNPTLRATAMFCGQPQEMTQAPVLQGPSPSIAASRTSAQNAKVGVTGFEPATF